jgi:hypothetical protein
MANRGDPYANLLEVPLFAPSDNHVGLQIADPIATTFILPMAASAYGAPACSVHATRRYDIVRANHGNTIRELQFRYRDEIGRWRGGNTVSDPVRQRSGALLFDES